MIENETNTDNYTEVNKQHLSLQNTYSPDLGVPNVCKLELNREKIARAMFYIVAISHGIWQVRFISIIWCNISTYYGKLKLANLINTFIMLVVDNRHLCSDILIRNNRRLQ